MGHTIQTHPALRHFYVVCVISNPVLYESRYALYRQFIQEMTALGVQVMTVEVAFGDRLFEVTEPGNPFNIQLRTWDELWHKENMINLGISRLPSDWEYVGWFDADISFLNKDVIKDAIQALQHYMFIQPWQNAIDMGPNGETLATHNSFCWSYWSHKPFGTDYAIWHPGYAWCARREALEAVGGLIDIGILGSGDRHMATALLGKVGASYNHNVHKNYSRVLEEWQTKAERHIKRDIGFCAGTITHHFHGAKRFRGYKERWNILVENQFNPETDIKRDTQGLWQLEVHSPRQIELRDDIRRYFRSRNEDSVDVD